MITINRQFFEKIGQLSREIDLMIINEYFDEALILLKKLMCWDYEDILYISKGMRSSTHRFNISNVVADKVKKWSAGDVMLYDHFNGTFWTKIQEYGSSFGEISLTFGICNENFSIIA